MKTNFRRQRSRSHVMRSAKRREEVIECVLVGDVHARQAQAPSVPITVEDVVFSNGSVEEIAWLDARWILVIVLRPRGWNFHQVGCKLRSRARTRQRCRGCCADAAAHETGLELLICCQ